MEYYNLGDGILTFSSDRTVGREGNMIKDALLQHYGNDSVDAEIPFFYPHQTHTDHVLKIDDAFLTLTAAEQKNAMEGIDAVISDVPGIVMGISTADCIPVLIFDPEHHAAAAIHSGWKGTVQRIAAKALAAMQDAYHTVPSVCRVAIGPGISQQSFEVGQEVVDKFSDAGFKMDSYTIIMPAHTGDGTKPHIDLKGIIKATLTEKGVRDENIHTSTTDTFTDELYFSARREQRNDVKCGRNLTGFVLKH